MNKLLLTTLLLSVTAASHAMDNIKTVCSHGNETRVIEVAYTGDGAVPCEVRYAKSDGSKVLWSANNAVDYCEAKANAFIEKQKGWGWNCEVSAMPAQVEAMSSEVEAMPEAAETMPAQESTELAPAAQ